MKPNTDCPHCDYRSSVRDGYCLQCGGWSEVQTSGLESLPPIWRAALPILPAWLVGAMMLLISRRLWAPVELGPSPGTDGGSTTPAFILIVSLLVGSVLYALSPRLGPHLTVSTSSSYRGPVVGAIGGQTAFGEGFLRCGALVGMYLMVWMVYREYA